MSRRPIPIEQRAFLTKPCASCGVEPRYSPAVSYCRGCVRVRCQARWKRIASDPAELQKIADREAERNLHVGMNQQLRCNVCRLQTGNVRELISHKRTHANWIPPEETYSLLPSTCGWAA